MLYRTLGNSQITVSELGFGAGHVGSPSMSEDEAGTILNRAADRGITFFDTARGYGLSEERFGRHLSWRRKDLVIATKVGYMVEGTPDWSYDAVVRGTQDALWRMQTDYIDVVLLHSCPREVLEREDIQRALEDVVKRGMVRVAGYSGENEALEYALGLPMVGVVECSLNICDQASLDTRLSALGSRGLVAKRPLANAFWRFDERPEGDYSEEYWSRWQTMGSKLPKPLLGTPMDEVALGFVLANQIVSTAIVGTGKVQNLEHNISMAESIAARGYLKAGGYEALRELWGKHGVNWRGEV